MIDLHLHLDGSLTPQDLLRLSRLTGVALPTQQEEELRA
ncbi:MAG TPA: adenosine deaminase, partial [Clostridiales bacterium]|nr:adenosine deaminase [Clostridiales bacterium]